MIHVTVWYLCNYPLGYMIKKFLLQKKSMLYRSLLLTTGLRTISIGNIRYLLKIQKLGPCPRPI